MKVQRDALLKALLGVLVFVALGVVIAAGVVVGVDALRCSESEPSALMPTTTRTESASVSTGTVEDSVSTADPRHPFAAIRGWIVYVDTTRGSTETRVFGPSTPPIQEATALAASG
jgi:hypothetical protein